MSIGRRLTAAAACVVVTSAILLSGAHVLSAPLWVTGWGTSQQALGDTQITNATVRMIARVTIPGDGVRIRLDNTFGTGPVTIGRAQVGHRIQRAALAAGSNRPVTFDGKPDVTIPAAGSV